MAVPIVQTYTGIDERVIPTVLDATADGGLVWEGPGLGNVLGGTMAGMCAALDCGLPVVVPRERRAAAAGRSAVARG